MKRLTLLFILTALTSVSVLAQLKKTNSATVSFDASTSLDNLPKAENKTVYAEIDVKTGDLAFEATVKNFAFTNPGMQNHFNNKGWLNSDEFPLFTFSGKIADLSKINFAKNGSYSVTVSGDLVIKNISKPVTTDATIIIKDGALSATSSFSIKLSEYNITNVSIDAGKVAKEPRITVSAELK
jgi:polyisoprenoid-binding protein YceI